MRDVRFIARHRGGPLEKEHHRQLAAWAACCAEHVLSLHDECDGEPRLLHAVATARAWARGEVPVGAAQKAAVAAHAAARAMTNPAAVAVARAAGHAVATAHMAEHSLGAALYAIKALTALGAAVEAERAWQIAQAPDELRELVVSALHGERFRGWHAMQSK